VKRTGPNLFIVCIALIYFLEENRYFHWNKYPKSDAELICDGILFVIFALACLRSGDKNE
jgi:hypothetical protein